MLVPELVDAHGPRQGCRGGYSVQRQATHPRARCRHRPATPAPQALAAAVLLWSAQSPGAPRVSATGQVALTADDNISSSPPDVPAVAAFGIEVTPGIALTHEGARERILLRYSHPVLLYLAHVSQSSDADAASAIALFHLTPFDELLLDLELRRQSSTLLSLGSSEQTTAEARLTGGQTLLPLSLSQALRHDFSPAWSLEQSTSAAVTIPVGSDSAQQLVATGELMLAPELALGSHAFALQPSLRYTHGEPAAAADAAPFATVRTDQLVPSAALRWRWDWTRSWSSEARAGVAIPILLPSDVAAAPVAAAAIRWDEPGYALSLQYARDYRPDSLTARTYYSDSLLLAGTVPLWRAQNLHLAASTGFAWNRLAALEPTSFVERADTGVTDLSVGWRPRALVPSLSVRYQHLQQLASPAGQVTLLDFSRNVVSLVLGYQYPVELEPGLSGSLPRRVDRGDAANDALPARKPRR